MVITGFRGNRHRARITSQGQITVPKAVRVLLGAKPGDDLEFDVRDDEVVVRRRARVSVLDFAGIADEANKLPATAEEFDEQIADAWAAEAAAKEQRIARAVRAGRARRGTDDGSRR